MNIHNALTAPQRFMRAICFAALALSLSIAPLVGAAPGGNPGFLTSQPSMLTPAGGNSVLPIITVGDTLPNGYRYEAIPDGIGVTPNGKGTVDVFVAHETSLVPFPFTGNVATCTCNGEPLKFANELPATGPIGLEADRGQMEYRRLRIKETR